MRQLKGSKMLKIIFTKAKIRLFFNLIILDSMQNYAT